MPIRGRDLRTAVAQNDLYALRLLSALLLRQSRFDEVLSLLQGRVLQDPLLLDAALAARALNRRDLEASYRNELQARFRFICRAGAEDRPQIAAFRQWVLDEIAKTTAVTEALDLTHIKDVPA